MGSRLRGAAGAAHQVQILVALQASLYYIASMALIKSPLYSIIIGSVGDWTFQVGRGGKQVVRSKPNPIWPATAAQLNQSLQWNIANASWTSKTESERQAYHAWSQAVEIQNFWRWRASTGRYFFLANAFARLYIRSIFTASFSGSNDFAAPSVRHFLSYRANSLPVLPASPDVARIRISNLDQEPVVAAVWLSPAVNKTVNYYKGPWDMTLRGRALPLPGASATISIAGATIGMRHFWICRITTRTQTGISFPARAGFRQSGFIDF